MAKKETHIPAIIDTPEALEAKIAAMKEAQKLFATYTQEQVDKIFKAAATAADKARIPLAKAAVEETGMGIVEDKVIKNHYASEYIYNAYKNTKTCGVIEEDPVYGIKKIAEAPLKLQKLFWKQQSKQAHRKASSDGSTYRAWNLPTW